MNNIFKIFNYLIFSILMITIGCSTDDPKKEDAPELITKATLTFTPTSGGNTVIVSASDPDGEGVQDLAPEGPVNLSSNATYDLTIKLVNELATPDEEGYDISDEVKEEGAEHLILFSWTNDLFSSPSGNGNIDNRADEIIYSDTDSNNQPIGLITRWTTAGSGKSGNFRIVLKHQPDLKNDTSGINVGETDMDISFTVSIP